MSLYGVCNNVARDQDTRAVALGDPDGDGDLDIVSGDEDSEVTACENTTASCFSLLTVNKDGPGTGTVRSDPGGISCGADCTETYGVCKIVTLTAHPGVKSYFVGWSGDCEGTERTAQVTMDADRTCTATFGSPVGGIVVPVSKLGLVMPWMGLSAWAGLSAIGVVLFRRHEG